MNWGLLPQSLFAFSPLRIKNLWIPDPLHGPAQNLLLLLQSSLHHT